MRFSINIWKSGGDIKLFHKFKSFAIISLSKSKNFFIFYCVIPSEAKESCLKIATLPLVARNDGYSFRDLNLESVGIFGVVVKLFFAWRIFGALNLAARIIKTNKIRMAVTKLSLLPALKTKSNIKPKLRAKLLGRYFINRFKKKVRKVKSGKKNERI